MSNASTILTVGTFDCNDGTNTDLMSLELGVPQRGAEVYSGPQFDLARVGATDTSELVETTFTVLVTDTSVDAVGDRIAALAAQLRDLADITVGLKGSDNTGTLKPKIASCARLRTESPYDSMLVNKYKAVVEVSVMREPWVYGATATLHSATAISVPGVVDLAAMTGIAAAPLTVEFDAAGSNKLHQLVAGVYGTDSQAVAKFVLEAHDQTFVGTHSDDNESAAYGGGYVAVRDADSGAYADFDVTGLAAGSYYVIANARVAGAGTGTVATAYTAAVTVSSATYRRHVLGVVTLPATATRGVVSDSLRVTICGDETAYLCLNTIEFVPVTAGGMVGWHHSTPTSYADKLRWEDDVLYADDEGSHGYSVGGRRLMANGGTLFVTGEGATAAASVAVYVTVTYRPRWETFIP